MVYNELVFCLLIFFNFWAISKVPAGGGQPERWEAKGAIPPPFNHKNKIHIFFKHRKVGYLKYLRNEIDFYNKYIS